MFVDKDLNTDDYIVNLAAQASVFYGQLHPEKYIHSNVVGFHNLLELARSISCKHLIYASTSSVYGGNTNRPYSVHDNVDHPVSLYAATKKSNELLSHVYSYTYGLPTTGLRFFTVYGPWGRPDMAYYLFTRAILAGEPITVYNHGDMSRDFTYIDDIIEAIVRLLDHIPELDVSWDRDNPDPATSWIPYRIFNIGNQHSINLLDFVHVIEDALGKKADIDLQPMRTGDVKDTFANIDSLNAAIGFKPSTPIQEGIGKFVEWYLDYYKVKL